MRRIIELYSCLIFLTTSFYELRGQHLMSLEDCISIAVHNSYEINNANLDIENAQLSLNQSKMGFLPDLNASVTHRLNNYVFNELIENTQTGNMSLSSSMPLFNWFKTWKTIELSDVNLTQQEVNKRSQSFDLEQKVIRNYFQLMTSKAQYEATSRQVLNTSQLLEFTESLYKSGKVMRNDVAEVELQYTQELSNVVAAKNSFEQAYYNLQNTLQVGDSLQINYGFFETYVVDFSNHFLHNYQIFEQDAIRSNPNLNVLKIQYEYLKKRNEILKIQNKPYIRLGYSLSSSYNQSIVSNSEVRFNDHFENNLINQLSASLVVPIFNRNETLTSVKINQNEMLKYENQINNVMIQIENSLHQLHRDAVNGREGLKLAQKEMEQSSAVLDNRYALYRSGKIDIFTVLSYKRQNNLIERAYIQDKYLWLLKIRVLELYLGTSEKTE